MGDPNLEKAEVAVRIIRTVMDSVVRALKEDINANKKLSFLL